MSLYPSSPDTVCSGQCPASQCATLRISLSMIAGPTHWSWAAIKHGHMSMHHTLCQPIVSLNTKPTGRPLILHFHFLIFVPLNQSIGVDPFFSPLCTSVAGTAHTAHTELTRPHLIMFVLCDPIHQTGQQKWDPQFHFVTCSAKCVLPARCIEHLLQIILILFSFLFKWYKYANIS